jgi:hypothetical protein
MQKTIKVGLATRTLRTRPVTYRCEWCSTDHTEERYPGPKPRYCSEVCKQEAQNTLAAARMRRKRKKYL